MSKSTPHIIAILSFLLISSIYFLPQISGYQLRQSDQDNYLGMSKEIIDFRDKFDEEPLWTNAMFGGMPAFQISTKNPNLINKTKNLILKIIPRPIGYLFFLMLGFYIMLMCFRIDKQLAIIGSIAFGLASLNILLLATGHNSKVHAISFIPPIIGSIYYAYRTNALRGGILLSIFLCLHLSANHLQMTYYLIFLITGMIIYELISYIRQKSFKRFINISFILLFSAILGTLPTVSNLIITYEYGKSTIRGERELTIYSANSQVEKDSKGALDPDYIKEYSFALGEIWSIAIPNIKGGASERMGNNPDFRQKVNPKYQESISQRNVYWGEQRGTGGAIYFGAGIFLLFILGAFFVSDKFKWALIIISVLSILLSIKYNVILDLFIEYVPLFNKFRDTKMMLILAQVSFPLLGVLFLNHILSNKINKRKFLYITGSVTIVFLIFYIIPGNIFDFFNRYEQGFNLSQIDQYKNNSSALFQINSTNEEIKNFRLSILRADVIRSLVFILGTGILIYLFIIGKLKKTLFLSLIGVLFVIDLWVIDKRNLDNEKYKGKYKHWVESYEYNNPFVATAADISILNNEISKDPELKNNIQKEISNIKFSKSLKQRELQIEKEKLAFRELNFGTNYRVFSLVSPFVNSRTSYYHKSIGGYHGAKLRRFQDVVEFNIGYEQQKIIDVLKNAPTNQSIDNCLRSDIPVLNMLNTKYIITNTESSPIINKYNFGNVWFVNEIKFAETPNNEILSLKSISKNLAVLSIRNQSKIEPITHRDQLAQIQLTSYKPNHLIYESNSLTDQFAVFSEIYYEAGWNVYIDGDKKEYFKTNYLLRGMNIPSGIHKIEFKFEPASFYMGRKISLAGSTLIFLFIILGLFYEVKNKKKATASKQL